MTNKLIELVMVAEKNLLNLLEYILMLTWDSHTKVVQKRTWRIFYFIRFITHMFQIQREYLPSTTYLKNLFLHLYIQLILASVIKLRVWSIYISSEESFLFTVQLVVIETLVFWRWPHVLSNLFSFLLYR